ncbi:MAG: methyltransferase domain-containing protein [Nitrospina sp.]|jgi:predicted SAM-dependent methyltransferase|nr:methyltransferase domain-containing protein [Nitrospina sp.]
MKEVKINMGCGWRNFGKDWIHIDGSDYDHLDYRDICKLEFDNDVVDLIYASHVIEYFDREEVNNLLSEWRRVLRPGGKLRIAVPNFQEIASIYLKGEYNLENFLGPLYGKMKMENDFIYHKTCYDFENLKKILTNAGFRDIIMYDWRKTDHSNFDDHSQAYIPHMDKENGTLISLNVECKK